MTAARDAAFQAWKRKAEDADILHVALSKPINAKLRKAGSREWVGPCPVCLSDKGAASDRFSVNPFKGLFNCRGSGGGDIIAMVMHACNVEFLAAVEIITGEPPPDGSPSNRPIESPEDIARREAEHARREQDRDIANNQYRESERHRAKGIWDKGIPIAGTSAQAYLRLRGIATLPDNIRLRCIETMPYYGSGKKDAGLIHRGPALLAPIVGGERIRKAKGDKGAFSVFFCGVHITYIDLAQPKGKLRLPEPDKPGKFLDAKKVRGSQAGGSIILAGQPEGATRVIIGEGIEKTLAVWFAMQHSGRDLAHTLFLSAINLGNLGGKHAATLRNPYRNPQTGRHDSVHGPEPDLSVPGIWLPPTVGEVTILGDTSPEPHKLFAAQCAVARAATRFAQRTDGTSRLVRVAWSPAGSDFDDMLRRAA